MSEHDLDPKSQAFLRVVYECGGSAATTKIRDRTGLDQYERNYRFGKLEERDLITISEKEEDYAGPNPPKVAVLTEEGEELVESGALSPGADDIIAEHEHSERVEELEERVERIEGVLQEVCDRLDQLEAWRERLGRLFMGD